MHRLMQRLGPSPLSKKKFNSKPTPYLHAKNTRWFNRGKQRKLTLPAPNYLGRCHAAAATPARNQGERGFRRSLRPLCVLSAVPQHHCRHFRRLLPPTGGWIRGNSIRSAGWGGSAGTRCSLPLGSLALSADTSPTYP
jgi:hypothetical protein